MRVIMGCLIALAASHTAHADDGDRWDGKTMALQAVGGLGGGVLGGAVGGSLGLVAAPIVANATGSGNAHTPLVGAAIGGVLGGSVGVVLGVQYIGGAEGGTGHWYGTTLGEVGGLALFGTYVYAFADHPPPRAVSILLGTTLVLGGPILGYHLTADAHRAQPTPRLVVSLFVATF